MAFLDNSRDIILDAVLTDLGRRRLAEGKFSIQRFGLGDDEINYGLYNPNHPSGSAYYDIELLQSPVFEAFTNNISTMNSRLVTYASNNLLYLPILKLNTLGTIGGSSKIEGVDNTVVAGVKRSGLSDLTNVFLIAVDDTTFNTLNTISNANILKGSSPNNGNYVRIDQGIDTNAAGYEATKDLAQELVEDQYTVEIDNRFGFLSYGNTKLEPTFIDDDNVALYTFSRFNTSLPIVVKLEKLSSASPGAGDKTNSGHVLNGARGTALSLGVYANSQLDIDNANTNSLFTIFGTDVTINSVSYRIIHTTMTVTGLKTGYSIDVPVSFIKRKP